MKNFFTDLKLFKYCFVLRPEVDLPSKSYTEQSNQTSTSKICINNIHGNITTKKELKQSIVQKVTRNKGTQTDYRDSDTQTDPWLPPCIITNNSELSRILILKSGYSQKFSSTVNE